MRVNGLTKGFFILIVFIVTAFLDVLSPAIHYSAILWDSAIRILIIFGDFLIRSKTRSVPASASAIASRR